MSLWTRLIYGTSSMEEYYKKYPDNRNTIQHFESITYNSYIPVLYSTYEKTKNWLNKYCPQCILPPMSYEEIINIMESLPNKNFLTEPLYLVKPNQFIGFSWNHIHIFNDYKTKLKSLKTEEYYGWIDNDDNPEHYYIHFFYYWRDNDALNFSEYILFYRFKEYLTSQDINKMPIFFNPKTFRDYALLCITFSNQIAKEEQKKKELERQVQTNKEIKRQEQKKKEEYAIRERQIEMLNDLKKELQQEQDKETERFKKVSQENIQIANRLKEEYNV